MYRMDWKFKGLGVWYAWHFFKAKKNLFFDIKPLFFGSTNISENNKSILYSNEGRNDKFVSDSGFLNQSTISKFQTTVH